jgi:hypothetical protein
LSKTSPLIPLASNELFDGGPTSKVTRQRIQVAPAVKHQETSLACSPRHATWPQRGAPRVAKHPTLTVQQETKSRDQPNAQLFCPQEKATMKP